MSRPAARGRRGCAASVTAAVAVLLAGLLTACSHGSGADTPPGRAQLQAMLAAHARAVRAHDRQQFLAGVDPAAAAARFRAGQRGEFANLVRLPLTTWSYTLGQRANAPGAQRAAQRRFGPSAVIYQVTLRVALRGIDSEPSSHQLYWTFARVDGRVVAADDSALDTVGGASWRGPWDFGPLTVVTGRHSLVLGHAATGRPLLRLLADTVDAAVPRVTAVWGAGWSRDVLVVVPAEPAELQAALGSAAGDPAQVVAVATSDGTDPVTGAVLGQRLVVEPQQLRGLSDTGLRVVVQHEVTHIADAAATSDATPTWLAEGFAEYVGNLGSGQPVQVAASELAKAVRAGSVPRRLPAAAAFTGPRAAQAYEEAWLACRLIAARAGQAGLVRLYRLAGRAPATPDAAAAGAVRRVLSEPITRFIAQWRRYLHDQLAGTG